MLTSIIGLAITLFLHPAPANSVALRGDVCLQDGAVRLSAQNIAQLKAQAEGGNAAAQLQLARAYDSGAGVPQDEQLAAKWYRTAAEQGNSEAQDSLGTKYLIGQGLEQNKEAAVSWFRKSARQGNASAMFHLGAAYYNGDGVHIDDSLSYAWFTLAKEAGSQSGTEAVQRAESELKARTINNSLKRIAEMYEKGESLQKIRPRQHVGCRRLRREEIRMPRLLWA